MTTYHLRKILRQQKSPELLSAVNEFSKGHVVRGLQIMDSQGWIHEEPSMHLRYRDIGLCYAESPDTTIAVSASNLERMDLNAVVQKRLRRVGHIDQKEYRIGVLVNRQDLTNEAKRHALPSKLVMSSSSVSQISISV